MELKHILIVILVIIYLNSTHSSEPELISIETAKENVTNLKYDFVVDVRNQYDRESGFHAYSIHIPLIDLPEISKKISNKNNKLLIISESGKKSFLAADYLSKKGYKNIQWINDFWTKLI